MLPFLFKLLFWPLSSISEDEDEEEKMKTEKKKKNVRKQVWQTVSLWKSEMNDWWLRCSYDECFQMTGSH
jgi:hypothetical protein